jgi:outer membrane lipoprotein carrier protein
MNRRNFTLLALGAALTTVGPGAAQPSPGAPPSSAAPASISAQQIARRVQSFYDQARTYRADFKQRFTIWAHNRTKDSSGSVVFAKPGKMHWKYSSNGNVVVSDGKEIKIYEPDNKQMYLQKVNSTQYPAALAFLMGQGKLTEAFTLKKLNAKDLKFPGGYVLLGTPKNPTPAYQKILFYIDAKTFQVRRVLLIDAQKNRNRFDFSKARVNEAVKKGAFTFQPPPGTNVIKP